MMDVQKVECEADSSNRESCYYIEYRTGVYHLRAYENTETVTMWHECRAEKAVMILTIPEILRKDCFDCGRIDPPEDIKTLWVLSRWDDIQKYKGTHYE